MTTPCEFGDLDCPQEDNFAAIAKQLHETAVEAEDRIFCMEQQLRSAVNRPTFVATTTVDMGPFGSSDGLDSLSGSGLFSTTVASTINFSNSLLERSLANWLPSPGVWHIGAYGAAFPTGAATDNSYRQLRIIKFRINPGTGANEFLQECSHTSFESANGVQVLLCSDGVFKIDPGERIIILFRHGNIASTVSVATGAIVWFTRLSDSDVIRVI